MICQEKKLIKLYFLCTGKYDANAFQAARKVDKTFQNQYHNQNLLRPGRGFSEYLLIPGYTGPDCIPQNVSLRTALTKYR